MKNILYLFVLFISFNFACKNKESKQDGEFETGIKIEGDTATYSLEKMNELLKADPENPELLHKRGKVFIRLKKLDEAYNDIISAIEKDSTKSDYFLSLADVLFAGKKSAASKSALEKALQLSPESIEVNMRLAELYLLIKKHGLSVQHLDQVLRKDKFNAKAYFMKGMNFKESGDTSKALSSFQTAVEIENTYYDAYMQLGILFSMKHNPLAAEYYSTAISLQPAVEEAYYGRAMYYQSHGMYDKAIQDYKRIQEINPYNKLVHYNQGYIYLVYLEKNEAAIGYFGNAIQIDPEYTDAYFNRALAYEISGDKTNAKKDYLKVLELSPTYEAAKTRLKSLK